MKRRMVYLYRGNDDYYAATFGYGAVDATPDQDRYYHPSKASALRLARLMERILYSKKFWCVSYRPDSLRILFGEPEDWGPPAKPFNTITPYVIQGLLEAIGRHPNAESDPEVLDAINSAERMLVAAMSQAFEPHKWRWQENQHE